MSGLWKYSGIREAGLCNYEAAIEHLRNAYDDSENRKDILLVFGITVLKERADDEAEAFKIFQEAMDQPSDREMVCFYMVEEYRNIMKWNQSIDSLRLSLSALGKNSAMISQVNKAMDQTYLEHYCTTDTTSDTYQLTKILHKAIVYSQEVDEVSTEMHLTRAQIVYFHGEKQTAYQHLELYLDASLTECKLKNSGLSIYVPSSVAEDWMATSTIRRCSYKSRKCNTYSYSN